MRSTPSPRAERLAHVQAVSKPDGRVYLYYRRAGRRTALPGPEGSAAYLAAYDAVHRAHDANPHRPAGGEAGSVAAAITTYLRGADFAGLAPNSQRHYRLTLDRFRANFGPLRLSSLDSGWWEALRARYGRRPGEWNLIRSRMRDVIRLHRRLHPGALAHDPLAEVTRIKTPRSSQNRPWPHDVLRQVMQAATPEFRALLITYLLTAQRGGDVTTLTHGAYDQRRGLLTLDQGKTETPIILSVPKPLATALATMAKRHPDRLLVTPRGEPWTTSNAQETLRRMLANLGLDRFTLHGLRATGPTALVMAGVPNRAGRALTGHQDDKTYEDYTRGAAQFPLAQQAAKELERIFGAMVGTAEAAGNRTKASGVTGRAAAKARRGEVATGLATGNLLRKRRAVTA